MDSSLSLFIGDQKNLKKPTNLQKGKVTFDVRRSKRVERSYFTFLRKSEMSLFKPKTLVRFFREGKQKIANNLIIER